MTPRWAGGACPSSPSASSPSSSHRRPCLRPAILPSTISNIVTCTITTINSSSNSFTASPQYFKSETSHARHIAHPRPIAFSIAKMSRFFWPAAAAAPLRSRPPRERLLLSLPLGRNCRCFTRRQPTCEDHHGSCSSSMV